MDSKVNSKAGVVAVVGLGYVGLQLAVAFGMRQRTIGFDLSARLLAAGPCFLFPLKNGRTGNRRISRTAMLRPQPFGAQAYGQQCG